MMTPSDNHVPPVCLTHGTALIEFGSKWACPDCLDAQSATRRASYGKVQQLWEQQGLQRRLRASGVPPMYQHGAFADLRLPGSDGDADYARRLYGAMERYCADFARTRAKRTGFLFVGGPGTGKTHLACTMAVRLMQEGFDTRYTSLPSLTIEVRASYKDRSLSVQAILADLIHADLLIIDEIDLHGASDADYQMLYEVINARYVKGDHPTIALSNRDREYLAADLNDRILSRLLGEYPENFFNWPPFRSGAGL